MKSITGLEKEQFIPLPDLFAVNYHTWKAMKINNVHLLWQTHCKSVYESEHSNDLFSGICVPRGQTVR